VAPAFRSRGFAVGFFPRRAAPVRHPTRCNGLPRAHTRAARMSKYTLSYVLIALLVGFGVYLGGRPSRRSRDITLE